MKILTDGGEACDSQNSHELDQKKEQVSAEVSYTQCAFGDLRFSCDFAVGMPRPSPLPDSFQGCGDGKNG